MGASRGRVIAAIFRRPLSQVGLGVLGGGALIAMAASIETEIPGLSGDLSLEQFAILLAYTTLMLGVLPPRVRRPDTPRAQRRADSRAADRVVATGAGGFGLGGSGIVAPAGYMNPQPERVQPDNAAYVTVTAPV